MSLNDKICVNLLASGESWVEYEFWYLENGANNHIMGYCSKFHEFDENVTSHVGFDDSSTVAIMGKGSILFDCKNSNQKLLNEVNYIPSHKNIIISLWKMMEEGIRVIREYTLRTQLLKIQMKGDETPSTYLNREK